MKLRITDDTRDEIDFANEPVGQLFRRMLVPTLIGMVSIVVLNFTDGAFVGHGVGSNALAAINIAAPIFNILTGIGLMFGIGCSVVASIHLSRGKNKAANINVTQALIGSVGLTIALSIFILSDLPRTCRLFGSDEELIPLASSYLKWIALTEPLIMLDMVCRFLVRLDGNPKLAMLCSIYASALNIFLDWLFIFPMDWGLEGAAIATSISFSLSGLVQFAYMIWFSKTLHLYHLKVTLKSLWLSLRNVGYQIRMGLSAMLGEVSVSGTIIVGNYMFVDCLGEDGVAAYSVACYCFPFIFMMANAIVQSAQPIISYAYGVGNRQRLSDSYRQMIVWALGAGIVMSVLMYFGASFVTQLFMSANEPAFAICVDGLPYYGIGIFFATINIVLIGYLQSIEQSVQATIYTMLRGFIFVIPCFIFLPNVMGRTIGLWLAIPAAELLTLFVIVVAFIINRDRIFFTSNK